MISRTATKSDRLATHRAKMTEKAEQRERDYHNQKRVYVRPNNGGSNSIWPKGKVTKPGRMG